MKGLDELLRLLLQPSGPTEHEAARIDEVYYSAVKPAPEDHSRRPDAPRRVAGALAAVLVVSVAVASFLATRPTTAQATLNEIAEAARLSNVTDIDAGESYFTRSEIRSITAVEVAELGREIVYMLPEDREVWVTDSGSMIVKTTRQTPEFINPDDEALYYAAGLDAVDQIGETVVEATNDVIHRAAQRDWPTDPTELESTVREEPDVETDTDAVGVLLELISESPASAQLRAAVIETIGNLTVELTDQPGSGLGFQTIPTNRDVRILSFVLRADGQLLEIKVKTIEPLIDLEVPAGFVISETTSTPTIVTSNGP